jgi:hypothetical protein
MARGAINRSFIFSLGAVLILVLVGFLREFLFVNIGYQSTKVYYKDPEFTYELPNALKWLGSLTYHQLYYGKWVLTVLFYGLYYSITAATIHLLYRSRRYNRVTVVVHLILFGVAALFYLVGYLMNRNAEGYTLAREIMGLLQSPLILMILLPTFYLFHASEHNHEHTS